jgi:hypothetical protein
MKKANPATESELIDVLKETLKKELHIDQNKVEQKIVEITKWGFRSEIDQEINKILTEVKSNMCVGTVLKIALKVVVLIVLIFYWGIGFALAKGFWSTFFCVLPFYAWYLVIEAYVIKYGHL